jgi:ribosomal protein S18 acetylase RimI-like enzyme
MSIDDLIIRDLRAEDADDIVRIYESTGWKTTKESIIGWLNNVKYSKVLVAALKDKVVGKSTVDVVFPPYAEIVNVVIDPNYQGRGIGRRLIEESIKLAIEKGHNIIYLMCDPTNIKIHKFFASLGFRPGIIGEPQNPRGSMWLYLFAEGSFIKEFQDKHPFAQLATSRDRVIFHGAALYSMKWLDPVNEDSIEIFINGQPGQPLTGGIMPHISGISIKIENTAMEAWVKKEPSTIAKEEPAYFTLYIRNKSPEAIDLKVTPITTEAVKVLGANERIITLHEDEETAIEYTVEVPENFDIPIEYLTFPTVTTSLQIKYEEYDLIISAGFNYVMS